MIKTYQQIQSEKVQAFDSETLTVSASSDATFSKSFSYHIQQAYKALEREAERVARANAAWYDIEEGQEGYNEKEYARFKAPWEKQFPPQVVKAAFMDLAETQVSDCIHYAKKQWYLVSFNGRKMGAIGIFHACQFKAFCFDHAEALDLAFYEPGSPYEYACDDSLKIAFCEGPN